MLVFCQEQAKIRTEKEVEKANRVHEKKLNAMKKKQRTNRSSLTANTAQANSLHQEDQGKTFVYADFENICTYLENTQHFGNLFGDGAKTTVGPAKMTKAKAFDVFAVWMNKLNSDLLLVRRCLQQRVATYKKKYTNTKNFEENTGAGVLDNDGPQTLPELLDSKCPCYSCMDAIFREKANVTPMLKFDHSHILARLPPNNTPNDSNESDEEMALGETQIEEISSDAPSPDLLPPPLDLSFEATTAASTIGILAPIMLSTPAVLADEPHPNLSASGPAHVEGRLVCQSKNQPTPTSRASNAPKPNSKMTLASSIQSIQ
jgi:hypothetical protein